MPCTCCDLSLECYYVLLGVHESSLGFIWLSGYSRGSNIDNCELTLLVLIIMLNADIFVRFKITNSKFKKLRIDL